MNDEEKRKVDAIIKTYTLPGEIEKKIRSKLNTQYGQSLGDCCIAAFIDGMIYGRRLNLKSSTGNEIGKEYLPGFLKWLDDQGFKRVPIKSLSEDIRLVNQRNARMVRIYGSEEGEIFRMKASDYSLFIRYRDGNIGKKAKRGPRVAGVYSGLDS